MQRERRDEGGKGCCRTGSAAGDKVECLVVHVSLNLVGLVRRKRRLCRSSRGRDRDGQLRRMKRREEGSGGRRQECRRTSAAGQPRALLLLRSPSPEAITRYLREPSRDAQTLSHSLILSFSILYIPSFFLSLFTSVRPNTLHTWAHFPGPHLSHRARPP